MENKSQPPVKRERYRVRNNVLNLSTAREFLELCETSYQKVPVPDLSPEEAYEKRMIQNIVDDMAFFFQQYLRLENPFNPDKKTRYLDQRMDALLDEIEEHGTECKQGIVQQLHSEDGAKLTALVFILSSVDCDQMTSPCLNKVLAAFSTCDDKRIPAFVDGLSHGRHPKLTGDLHLLQAIATEHRINRACTIIVQNRTDNVHQKNLITDNP